jgi:TPR repeat protein
MKKKPPIAPVGMWDLIAHADRFEDAGRFREAFRCYSEGALLGYDSCQLNLGNYYAAGRGVRRNLKMAEYWYRKAFVNGNSSAPRNLAIDKLAAGKRRSAMWWLRRGVQMKDGGSYVLLARLYLESGHGKARAARLLRRVEALAPEHASELDKENAQSLLKTIRGDGGMRRRHRKLL